MIDPPHVKWEDVMILFNSGLFFLYNMLLACKLKILKEVVVRVDGQLEPEGEVIVGPGGR